MPPERSPDQPTRPPTQAELLGGLEALQDLLEQGDPGRVREELGRLISTLRQPAPEEARLRANAERLAGMVEAQREIGSADLDHASLLRLVLDAMVRLTGAEGGSLEMVAGDEMVYEAATGLAEPFVGLRLKIAGSLSGLCVTQGELLRADDTEADPRVDRDACRRIGLRSMLVTPLRYDKDLFGALKLMSGSVAAFDAAAEDTLRWMSGFLGATIARQRAQEALRQSERRSRQVVESLPQLVWTCVPAGACDYLSPQWVRYTGKDEAEQLGYGWLEQLHPEDRARTVARWQAVAAKGENLEIEFRIRRHDGVYRWFRTLATPLRDDSGAIVKWFGSNTDIEDIKQAQEVLRMADRRKDEFLTTLAHELRNPLAPIRNALHVLRRPADADPSQERLLAMMERQVNHLVRLVDDLLEVSRITGGKIKLQKTQADLVDILDQAIEISRPLIDASHHALGVSVPEAPLWLEADPVRLAQVFANLLNNAAKYMDRGGRIQITVERRDSTALVSVRDQGIGIAAETLPRVFELFAQIDRGLDRSQGGLGVGLALVHYLVEMHGGRVEARSQGPGLGSEFVVQLPLAVPAQEEAVPEPPRRGASPSLRRLLIVDDNADAADSLGLLLESPDTQVRVVYDGLAALKSLAGFRPQVVLLDLGMPVMDGYETARLIREHPDGRSIVLVALTGWGQDEDRRRTREAGFDHHLVKPVDVDILLTLLAALDDGDGTAATSEPRHMA